MILSTHILPEVQAVCNRIHILNEGRIVYDDADATQQDNAQLTVQFNQDVDVNEMLELSSIQDIVRQETGRYVITHDAGSSPANAIASMAVENQWGLQELTPVDTGLEHIFVSLTQGDVSEESSDQEEQAA